MVKYLGSICHTYLLPEQDVRVSMLTREGWEVPDRLPRKVENVLLRVLTDHLALPVLPHLFVCFDG